MKTVVVVALDGMMDSSLAITLDTIRAGQTFLAAQGKSKAVRILVTGHRKTVRTGAGLHLDVDETFGTILSGRARPDCVIVPALGLTSDDAVSQRFRQKDAVAAMDLLRNLPPRTRIAASCSSVFLLASAGLLSGRHATMTWWLAGLFRARYPDVRLDETKMVVRDGRFLTAGSAYSQLDLMLAVITEMMGTRIAHLCSRYLLIDERPSQARYMMLAHTQQVDPTVIAAERWIDAHLSEPISVAALASELSVSPKTLSRRVAAATGVSPVKLVQRRRLLHASHLIETTSMSIEAVAAQVGYQDGTALRKLVKREFATTPLKLRS